MFIEPTTASATKEIFVNKGTTFSLRGALGSGVTVEFRIKDAAGGWLPLKENGEAVVLSDDNMQFVANGSCWIQAAKPETANNCGVEAC